MHGILYCVWVIQYLFHTVLISPLLFNIRSSSLLFLFILFSMNELTYFIQTINNPLGWFGSKGRQASNQLDSPWSTSGIATNISSWECRCKLNRRPPIITPAWRAGSVGLSAINSLKTTHGQCERVSADVRAYLCSAQQTAVKTVSKRFITFSWLPAAELIPPPDRAQCWAYGAPLLC